MAADRWLGVDAPEQSVPASELPSSLECERHAAAFDQLFYAQNKVVELIDEEITQPPYGRRSKAVDEAIIMVRHFYDLEESPRLVRATIVSFGSANTENAYCLVEEGHEHSFWVHKLRVMDKNTYNPHFIEWPSRPGTHGQLKALARRLRLET